ncbi:hypothetical protein DERF_014084 [Dermatophagoides farinae]|uniref:Uncharacterized protein n=1 Tax=Dermatophagoides farinae TaxID=6954 RepID=A0A922HGR7_DERFA|nr:hypothetical protein DERF_014084 [Dermatophagoides farinae]
MERKKNEKESLRIIMNSILSILLMSVLVNVAAECPSKSRSSSSLSLLRSSLSLLAINSHNCDVEPGPRIFSNFNNLNSHNCIDK